jgi:hypothetical protein
VNSASEANSFPDRWHFAGSPRRWGAPQQPTTSQLLLLPSHQIGSLNVHQPVGAESPPETAGPHVQVVSDVLTEGEHTHSQNREVDILAR